jgi:hypothetical protein
VNRPLVSRGKSFVAIWVGLRYGDTCAEAPSLTNAAAGPNTFWQVFLPDILAWTRAFIRNEREVMFDDRDAEFRRTTAEHRLGAPVLTAAGIVSPNECRLAFDRHNAEFVRTTADSRLPPPIIFVDGSVRCVVCVCAGSAS